MRINLCSHAIISRYFNSRWIPAVTTLIALAAFTIAAAAHCHWKPVVILADMLFVMLGISLFGVFLVSIWNLSKRRWANGLINLLALFVCSVITAVAFLFLMVGSMSGPSEDGFGKDIVIPSDMKIELPLPARPPTNGGATDSEGQALLASFSAHSADSGAQNISVELPVLNEFAGQKRALLLRHLASSAKWFVTKERGEIYAYRRCVINGRWQNNLNGYYSASMFDGLKNQQFQFRIIIGPNGPVMNEPWWQDKATMANILDRVIHLKAIDDNKDGQGVESYLILESQGAALEIFEQSPRQDRPFTPLALQQINSELQSVLSSPMAAQRGFDPSLMPSESIKSGEPDIHIENSMQRGIYFVFAYVNPGESGYAYLKVFEATKGTPLSVDKMSASSIEYIGWSDNPKELFFYTSENTIYEGDWGVYYPARFELWFVPDSGKPERKLIENIFKIEGWQR